MSVGVQFPEYEGFESSITQPETVAASPTAARIAKVPSLLWVVISRSPLLETNRSPAPYAHGRAQTLDPFIVQAVLQRATSSKASVSVGWPVTTDRKIGAGDSTVVMGVPVESRAIT